MIRLFFFIIIVFCAAFAFGWLAQRPGQIILEWQWLGAGGYEITLTTFAILLAAFVIVSILLWSIFMFIVRLPNYIRNKQQRRAFKKGFDSLSKSVIALKSGEVKHATKMIKQAKKYVPNNNIVSILESENALLQGNINLAKEKYKKMLEDSETKLMALHELYKIAISENKTHEAQSLAVRAYEISPKIFWASEAALFASVKLQKFNRALSILEKARDYNLFDKENYARKKAVLLTAQAQQQEGSDWQNALALASQAHKLAPNLVAAATLLARLYIRQGKMRKATKILLNTWEISPHPDLAENYVYIAASARERLNRAKNLIKQGENHDSLYVLALAAFEAREWELARNTLKKLLEKNQTKKACLLMADIEQAENNTGKMQFWQTKANSASEYAWVYKNHIEDKWQAAEPTTGELDVFKWQMLAPKVAPEKIIETRTESQSDEPRGDQPATIEPKKQIQQTSKVETQNETLLNKTTGLPTHAPDDPGSKGAKKKKNKNFFFYG